MLELEIHHLFVWSMIHLLKLRCSSCQHEQAGLRWFFFSEYTRSSQRAMICNCCTFWASSLLFLCHPARFGDAHYGVWTCSPLLFVLYCLFIYCIFYLLSYLLILISCPVKQLYYVPISRLTDHFLCWLLLLLVSICLL